MGGAALRLRLQMPQATLERFLEGLLEPATEDPGEQPVVRFLRPNERHAVTSFEVVETLPVNWPYGAVSLPDGRVLTQRTAGRAHLR